MVPIWYFMVGFVVVALLLILIINSLPLVGYWWRFVWVKLHGGGLVLVKWRTPTDDYYKVGRKGKESVIVKKRNERIRTTLTIPHGKVVFYRLQGVDHCDVDEYKNAFCRIDYEAVPGMDAETYEVVLIREMMRNRPLWDWKLILVAVGLCLIGIIVLVVLVNKLKNAELAHFEQLWGLLKANQETLEMMALNSSRVLDAGVIVI